MAKIYSAPIATPVYRHDRPHAEYAKAEREYVETIQRWATEQGGEHAGKMIKFEVADGYARYVVLSLKPVKLVHIGTADAYQFEYANRLTAKDVRERIERQERFDRMFPRV